MYTLPDDYNQNGKHSFCVLPWTHRFVNLGGEVQVCCTAEEYPHSYIKADNGRAINVSDGFTDAEIDATRHVREIRKSMLQGEWPAACERCRVTEQAGGQSRRHAENQHFAHRVPWILENTDEHGTAPTNIRSRDYRLGNLCNLRCRMCNPRASKLLLDEWNQVTRRSVRFKGEAASNIEHLDWFRDEQLWADFTANVPHLEHLHFAGGEPLVIPEVLQAMRICVDQGVAGNIELTFNTNVTKIPDKHRALWPEFRNVNLMCSVDAYGALNDYIRYPSKWSTISAVLDEIDQQHEELNIGWAMLSVTVQIYNIFHLHELIGYARDRFSFIHPMPNLVHLAVPKWFNIQHLPNGLKRLASERLTRLSGSLDAGHASSVDSILSYMEMGNHSLHMMSEFRRITRAFDRLRNESLTSLVPELAPAMEAQGLSDKLSVNAERGLRLVTRVNNHLRSRNKITNR